MKDLCTFNNNLIKNIIKANSIDLRLRNTRLKMRTISISKVQEVYLALSMYRIKNQFVCNTIYYLEARLI